LLIADWRLLAADADVDAEPNSSAIPGSQIVNVQIRFAPGGLLRENGRCR
jgi:hypothetical protein